MDEQAQNPAPETEAPAAVVDAAPETEAPAEGLLAQLEAVVAEVVHAIEQRSFGRQSAEHPVVVTTIVGGQ